MRGHVGTALAAAAVVLATVFPAVAATAEEAPVGTPLSVNVTDGSTATPTPTPTPQGSVSPAAVVPVTGPAGRSSGSPATGGSGAGPAAGGGGGGGAPAGSSSPSDEVNVAGMLYVGGVNASAIPSLDPSEGTVSLWFTVRNASTSVIDATASFWMDGAIFANRLDAVENVPVAGLQPGETRVVSVDLHHGGQWTLLSAHATLTPPASVDGTALTPVTRDALVVLFPWLLALAAVLLVLTVVLVRVLRSALAPAPAPTAAA